MFSSRTPATERCLRKDMEPGRSPGYSSVNKSQNIFSMITYNTTYKHLGWEGPDMNMYVHSDVDV